MEKSNIIISIIIVLCIAAAVAAYGITNSDNPIFSDLSSMHGKDTGHGLGNNSSINKTNGSSSVASTAGSAGSSSSDSGYSDGGSSSGSDSGDSYSDYSSSSSSSSSSDYSSDSSSSSSSGTSLSYSDAQSIAAGAVSEPGCYAGGGYYSDGYWYFTVYDQDGNAVDSISVSDSTGATGRG